MRRRTNKRRGIIVVWVAVTLLVLIAFVGLATDTAWVNLVGHQLQNTADASALAAALQVRTSTATAISKAQSTALANKAANIAIQLASNPSNSSTGDIVIGSYSLSTSTFTPTLTNPNAVQVLARLTSSSPNGALKLNFGPLAGISTSNVSRVATAMIGGTINAGLVILDPSSSGALSMNGTTNINVTNGAVVVDSSSSSAISFNGNTLITTKTLYINGNDTGASGVLSGGRLAVNSPSVPDPLAALAPPAKGATQSGNAPFLPGYYPNGLGPGTLAAGIYYVDNGISLKAGDDLNATAGVMIYLHTGGISMKGHSTLEINPPTSGTYAGISIYQDRSNSSAISLGGSTGGSSSGTLYFPSSAVSVQGGPNATASQIIAKTLSAGGNATVTVNYNGNFPVQGHEVFLVR